MLTLEVITGVCNLTRQGRLQKTTTTTTRNSTVCLCIFFTFRIFHIQHFTLRSAVLFCKPNSAFYTFAIFCILQSAFRILPVPQRLTHHKRGEIIMRKCGSVAVYSAIIAAFDGDCVKLIFTEFLIVQ